MSEYAIQLREEMKGETVFEVLKNQPRQIFSGPTSN